MDFIMHDLEKYVIEIYDNWSDFLNLKKSLTKIINFVTSDATTCELNASKSFVHSLGFRKIVLVNLENNLQLRLHVWNPKEIKSIMTPHTHPWDFQSVVLKGKIRNIKYLETDQEKSNIFKFKCKSSFIKNGYQFFNTGEKHIKEKSNILYSQGDLYFQKYKRL